LKLPKLGGGCKQLALEKVLVQEKNSSVRPKCRKNTKGNLGPGE